MDPPDLVNPPESPPSPLGELGDGNLIPPPKSPTRTSAHLNRSMSSGPGAQVRRSRVLKRNSTRFVEGYSPPASPQSSDGDLPQQRSFSRSYSDVLAGDDSSRSLRPANAMIERIEKNGAIDLGFTQRIKSVSLDESVEYIQIEQTVVIERDTEIVPSVLDMESTSLLDLAVFEDFEGTQPFFIGLDVDKEDYDLLKSLDVEKSPEEILESQEASIKREEGSQHHKKTKKPGMMASWLSRLVGSGAVSIKQDEKHLDKTPSPEPSDEEEILVIPSEFNQDGDARFSLDVEKKIYSCSHHKVGDRSRPLHDQVIISNLMLYIISVHSDVTMNRSGKRAKRGRRAPGGKKRRRSPARLPGTVPAGFKTSDLKRAVSPGRKGINEVAPEVVKEEEEEDVGAAIADILACDDGDDDDTPLGMLVKR
jgi:hypothetical protein